MSKYAGWAKRKMAGPRGHSNRAWSGGMGQGRSDADMKAEKEKKKEFDSKQDAASSFRGQQERRSENQRGSGNEIKALKSGHGAAALKRMVLIEDARKVAANGKKFSEVKRLTPLLIDAKREVWDIATKNNDASDSEISAQIDDMADDARQEIGSQAIESTQVGPRGGVYYMSKTGTRVYIPAAGEK